jgi:hypothetical protein
VPTGRRLADPSVVAARERLPQAAPAPQPHRHHVGDGDREVAVQRRALRQAGDAAGPGRVAMPEAPGQRPNLAGDALQQGRLAGAVRPNQRQHGAVGDAAAEVMHSGVAVVAEDQIVELQCRAHARSQANAQSTAAHSPASAAAAMPSRDASPARSSERGRDGAGAVDDAIGWLRGRARRSRKT